jgi:hypothetical protein
VGSSVAFDGADETDSDIRVCDDIDVLEANVRLAGVSEELMDSTVGVAM